MSKKKVPVESPHLPKYDKNVMEQFPEEVLKQAFARANARCQCEREGHEHSTFTCFKQIEWKNPIRSNIFYFLILKVSV